MSPSADHLANLIGRPLEEEDILVKEDKVSLKTESYEITGFGKIKRGLFRKHDVPTVEVREITELGHGEKTYSVPTDKDTWGDIIRNTDRTDIPSLKER
jgi:hypothetical protein